MGANWVDGGGLVFSPAHQMADAGSIPVRSLRPCLDHCPPKQDQKETSCTDGEQASYLIGLTRDSPDWLDDPPGKLGSETVL